jgi:CBS domain-containing protein
LVGTRDHLLGIVTREQLEQWRASEKSSDSVGSIVEGDFVHVHPDHPLDVVLDRLSETNGLLPVVSRVNVRRVEGVVTSDSILVLRDRRRSDVSDIQSR